LRKTVPLVGGTPRQKERPCPATGFLDVTDHIAADHFVECATDDLAQTRADELLADIEYPAMEVWMARASFCEAK
jgi:hypothetical protein